MLCLSPCDLQLVSYEFAVFGMWGFGGVVTDYLNYTNNSGNDLYFDTVSSSLLTMYQVGVRSSWMVVWGLSAG